MVLSFASTGIWRFDEITNVTEGDTYVKGLELLKEGEIFPFSYF